MAARRKKRREPKPPNPKKAREKEERAFGTLADRLGAKLKATTTRDSADEESRDRSDEPSPPLEEKSPPRRLSPEAAMAEAFAALDDGMLHADKFSGRGTTLEDAEIVAEEDDDAPTDDEETDEEEQLSPEDLLFFEAMADDVKPVDNKLAELKSHSFTGLHWHSSHELKNLSSVDLHEPELTGTQRDLLRRSRKAGRLNVANIRMMRRREALVEVAAFVHTQRREGSRFVRIITGKGRQSKDKPVLKEAVIEWCAKEGAAHVRGLAPETDQSGRYGSVVLELKRPEHS